MSIPAQPWDTTPATRPTGFRLRSADGRMMYPTGDQLRANRDWVNAETLAAGGAHFLLIPADATTAQYTVTTVGPVTAYRRRNTNTMFPEHITLGEWEAFRDSLGYAESREWGEDPEYLADTLYERVYGPETVTDREVDLTGFTDLNIDIDTLEDPDPSLPWDVAVTHAVFGPAFAIALPGVMKGIGERIAKDVEAAVPHAQIWNHKVRETGTVSGYIKLQYEDGRTFPFKDGRRTQQLLSTKQFEFDFPIPRDITAKSKAAAVAEYRKVVANIIDSIETEKPVVCAHCSGEGVVVGFPVIPASKKRR